MDAEEQRILNFLASMPKYGNSVVDKKQLKNILTETGGQMMACGELYEIKAKHLGVGTYRISLRPND